MIESHPFKICKRCELKLPADSFYKTKIVGEKIYRRGICKECEGKLPIDIQNELKEQKIGITKLVLNGDEQEIVSPTLHRIG